MKLSIHLFTAFLLVSSITTFSQNAIHFDGTNDVVQTTFPGVTGVNDRTFEAWIKVDVGASASNLCIMDYGVNVSYSRNTFNVSGSRALSFISGVANISSTAAVITEGQWTHVAFVLDNGMGFFYVNGVQVGTGSLSGINTPSTGQNLRIGERISGGSIPFEGAIDEVRIWNVARTAAQIANNYIAEFCSVPAGLVAYYTFNQGIAGGSNSGLTNLHNAVMNENGTLTNFSLSGSTSNWVLGAPITAGLTVYKNNVQVCDSMVSPSGLYTWTSTGSYYDTIANANSCDSIMRFGLTVNKSAYSIVNDTVCEPYVSPSGKYTYTSSGTYFDTTFTAKGCTHIHELNLDITILDTTVSQIGHQLTSNQANASHYVWLDCDDNYSQISGANSQIFIPAEDGNYAIRVRVNQCIDTSICYEVYGVGINDLPSGQFNIFPNPSKGELIVEGSFEGELSIIDSKGAVVYQTSIERNSDKSMSLPSSIGNGMYLVQFQNDQVLIRKKLIILRD